MPKSSRHPCKNHAPKRLLRGIFCAKFSLLLCSNRCGRVPTTTVIARSRPIRRRRGNLLVKRLLSNVLQKGYNLGAYLCNDCFLFFYAVPGDCHVAALLAMTVVVVTYVNRLRLPHKLKFALERKKCAADAAHLMVYGITAGGRRQPGPCPLRCRCT